MAARTAWVLNLDADIELAAGRPYSPTRAVSFAVSRHATALASAVLDAGDVIVDEATTRGSLAGYHGRAFCPTPRARRLLVAAGASPEKAPSVDVLRTVNSRAFCAGLGVTMDGAEFVRSEADALAALRRVPAFGRGWRLKHAFGMAGRGQRAVLPGVTTDADLTFIRRGLASGGLQVEPDVVLLEEHALHGFIEGEELKLGVLVRQVCDERGAWVSSERGGDLPSLLHGVDEALRAEARFVGNALIRAGYFGPFGIDAHVFRGVGGSPTLQPRSEINARYSMGFWTGFGRPPSPQLAR